MLSALYWEQKDEWYPVVERPIGSEELCKLGLSCKVIGAGGPVSICNVNVSRFCWPVGTDEVKFTVRTRISLASAPSPRALTLSQLCLWIPVSLSGSVARPWGRSLLPPCFWTWPFLQPAFLLKGLPKPTLPWLQRIWAPPSLPLGIQGLEADSITLYFGVPLCYLGREAAWLCFCASHGPWLLPAASLPANLGINPWGLVHGQSLLDKDKKHFLADITIA